MRTHVDLPESKIRSLRELASRRGFRGYSRLLAEAVDEYLARHGRGVDDERAARIARLRGSLTDGDARDLRRAVREIRKERA
jgi:metal-responsive CopG/Arc/MetJ family transcriptional regulator